MKEVIYLYSDVDCLIFFKSLFLDFELQLIQNKNFDDHSFRNKNILFVLKNEHISKMSQSFALNNNIVVLNSQKSKNIVLDINKKIKYISAPLHLKKFLDTFKNLFISNIIIFEDIEIFEEKITNTNLNLSCAITMLEKKILIQLINQKKINRENFLEKILKIKKDIETKTIESHLTRIRKKLLVVKSRIKISSKDDVFSIEN